MRFRGLALFASATVLGACAAGGDQQGTDTAAAGDTPGAQTTPAGQGGDGQMAPITGTTHEVRMLFDGQRYYFEPENVTIKQGDGVKWAMVSGAPHNVEFRAGQIPAGSEAQLAANMQRATGMMGPMMMQPNEEYTVSFGGVPVGTYNYLCTPHEMMAMKGTIIVE